MIKIEQAVFDQLPLGTELLSLCVIVTLNFENIDVLKAFLYWNIGELKTWIVRSRWGTSI